MGKFDFTNTISKVQNSFKKDDRRAKQIGLGESLDSSKNPTDFVVLPQWWNDTFGVLGLRFGHFVEIAGTPDSGKTSLSLLAIRCAQEQGYGVVYVETEGKTSSDDLLAAGIDPKGVMTIETSITEEMYDGAGKAIDAFFDDFPAEKLLLVIDSYGNTTSLRDSAMDLTQNVAMVGGAAKTNRMGLGSIKARQTKYPIAVLVVNYTYDNIGSVGKTNAGGRALDFYSMLTLQSSRKGWIDGQVSGQKVRKGAKVLWKVYKNHYAKAVTDENGNAKPLPKELELSITAEGIRPSGS